MPENLLVLLWRDQTCPRDSFTAELHESVPEWLHSGEFELDQLNLADAAIDAAAPLRLAALEVQPEAVLRVRLDLDNEWDIDMGSVSIESGEFGGQLNQARDINDIDPDSSAASTFTRLLGALTELTTITRSAGYLVATREPLADPTDRHSPGLRSPGFSQLALLRHRADLSTEAFRSRWLDHHTSVALETQSTFRYVQHIVLDTLTVGAPKLDGIVEECFPAKAMTDPHVFFDTGGDDQELTDRLNTMVGSVSAFLDLDALDVIPTSEFRFDVT